MLYPINAIAMDDCKAGTCIVLAVNDASLGVVAEGLESPTSMAFLGLDYILVLEKDKGTVQGIVNGQILPEPLLDVNVANTGERGMLGIDIANPDDEFDRPSYVFLYYTEAKGENGGIV